MDLTYLKMTGFRSFRDTIELDFSPGATFVLGNNMDDTDCFNSNGGGKSSLLLGIAWALYGELPTSAKKDEIINTYSDRVEVEVGFAGLVVRRIKIRSSPEQLSYYYKGEWHEGDLKTVQAGLNTIIKIGKDLFYNAIWIDRENKAVNFLFATPAKRLELLEEILGDSIYTRAKQVATKKKSEKEAEIKLLQSKLKDIEEQEQTYQRRLLKAKTDFANASSQVSERNRQHQVKMANLKTEVMDLTDKISTPEARVKLDVVVANKQAREIEVKDLNSKISVLNHRIKEIDVFLDKEYTCCPTCKREIPIEYTEDLQVKRRSLLEEVEEKGLVVKSLYNMIEDCQKQYDDFHKDKETRVRQQAELKRKKDELIQMQKVVLDQDPALIALGDSIREAETDLKRLQNNKQRFVEQINAFAKEIPLLKFWEEGFGTKGIRNMLLDDIRIMMAYYIKVYSEKLIGINTRIEIPIDSNKFDILVSYKGKTRDIATYSRGEVWRCCLVVLLTIRKILSVLNTFPFDIIFLDDCLGDIDETGVELIAETVMEELPKEFRYVFATIPRHIEKIPEDNIVIVNKRYGNSYI